MHGQRGVRGDDGWEQERHGNVQPESVYPLTITISPLNSGSVSANPFLPTYTHSTSVTLTPNSGSWLEFHELERGMHWQRSLRGDNGW